MAASLSCLTDFHSFLLNVLESNRAHQTSGFNFSLFAHYCCRGSWYHTIYCCISGTIVCLLVKLCVLEALRFASSCISLLLFRCSRPCGILVLPFLVCFLFYFWGPFVLLLSLFTFPPQVSFHCGYSHFVSVPPTVLNLRAALRCGLITDSLAPYSSS